MPSGFSWCLSSTHRASIDVCALGSIWVWLVMRLVPRRIDPKGNKLRWRASSERRKYEFSSSSNGGRYHEWDFDFVFGSE